MKKKLFIAAVAMTVMGQNVFAGGYLTNTNQSVTFLREPSRDASIGIDGAYSNPAGLLFLNQGFQVQANIQSAYQHRYVESTFAPFAYGVKNNGQSTKLFEGNATAPVIPSLHLSWNFADKWNINGSFMVVGGGGKCTFEEGLGSFEAAASLLPVLGQQAGLDIKGYSIDSYMQGKQYYYCGQVGVGYKVNDMLALSFQARLVYGSANYYGYIKDIKVYTGDQPEGILANQYFNSLHDQCIAGAQQCLDGAEVYAAMGMTDKAAELKTQAAVLQGKAQALAGYATMTEDVTLNCDQVGVGFTPILGIDFRPNEKWNFAAKYEFKTRMRLKNKSANSASADKLTQLAQFKDGDTVKEDIPAYLTLGAMYSPIPSLRINAGYHMFFDKQASKVNDAQELLDGNTFEINAGVEWDICKNWTISGGWQSTNYGNTDDYMKDISFTTSSNTFGFGAAWNINEHFTLDMAYFFTNYKKYTKESNNYNGTTLKGTDIFWRDNKVFGFGLTYKL